MNREAKILRDRRKELDISQQALATEVGLEVRQYQRFEYGQQLISHANMKLGLRICAALELDPFELVFEDGVDVAMPRKQNKKFLPPCRYSTVVLAGLFLFMHGKLYFPITS